MQNTKITRTREMTAYDFHRGTDTHAYEHLGVHKAARDAAGRWLYTVRVFAPHAVSVALCGDVVSQREIPLRRADGEGVFEAVLAAEILLEGMKYYFRLTTPEGVVERADPYARRGVWSGESASVVCAENTYDWRDSLWLWHRVRRRHTGDAYPFNAYQVHLGSFATRQGRSNAGGDAYLNYRELGELLGSYVSDMGYTHVLLMPLTEYPADASHGYLPSAMFAPTSRYGSPDDLREMVDILHRAGIGVLMDLPLGHFADGAGGLARFDGAPLYERDFGNGACTFDLTRPEVRNFLLSAALYWLREFHLDGLRPIGLPTHDTSDGAGNGSFPRALCAAVHAEFPDVLLLAEDSADPNLGFDLSCHPHVSRNLIRCLNADPARRLYLQDQLLLSPMEPLGERAVLPLSHDVACTGKDAIFTRMHGTYLQKFDTLRLCLAYLIAHPGKKLLFMTCELAQPRPWDDTAPPDWFLTALPPHADFHTFVRTLNRLYRDDPRLWQTADISPVPVSTPEPAPIVSFRRFDTAGRELLTAFNFSATPILCHLSVGTSHHSYRPIFPQKTAPIPTTPDGILPLTLPPHTALYLDPTPTG